MRYYKESNGKKFVSRVCSLNFVNVYFYAFCFGLYFFLIIFICDVSMGWWYQYNKDDQFFVTLYSSFLKNKLVYPNYRMILIMLYQYYIV